jgi:UDP-2,4-diacetamido-2,4,6-trideoxy-beta-L-altropyranose hydrolase
VNNLIIRADASSRMGTGHVMRCLALAHAWQEAGGLSYFALAEVALPLQARLHDEGMEVCHVSAVSGSEADAAETVALAQRVDAQWVVVDGYHFSSAYQTAIKEASLRLLFIDDYGHADHYAADLVLNQNIYANESFYTHRESYTRLLLGTDYALLRREFWPKRGWQRQIAPIACRLLVTLGGADPDNVTLQVVQALEQTKIDGLEVIVVVDGNSQYETRLQSAVQNSGVAIRLLANVKNIPELMAWADVAVSAGGSTCWELAFMGLPALTLTLADNQNLNARHLDRYGSTIHLGWHHEVSPLAIAGEITRLHLNVQKRAEMSWRGTELVDGLGSSRVAAFLQNGTLALRPAYAEDSELLWRWANDKVVRDFSFSTAPIPWEHHVRWLESRLTDPFCVFFIATVADNLPVGQVRYELSGEEAVISVSVDNNFRGLGYGSQIIRLSAAQLFNDSEIKTIHAYIKENNLASASAFLKAGFSRQPVRSSAANQASHFCLSRNQL